MSYLLHVGFLCWTLKWLLINYFFSTRLCVVLRVLKHGGKECGSRFQGELSDGHK